MAAAGLSMGPWGKGCGALCSDVGAVLRNLPTSVKLQSRSMTKNPNNAATQNLVGPQVRRLRLATSLSQESLAAKLQLAGWDLSRGGLSKIEAGLRRVNDAELWVLANVLACPLADLFPTRPKGLALVLRQGRG